MKGAVLTIDVGTTLIKGALFSDQGALLAKERLPLAQMPLKGETITRRIRRAG